MNPKISRAAIILGSLLVVGSAQATDNQGFQIHGDQFANHYSTDSSCVGRYTQGTQNKCTEAHWMTLGVTTPYWDGSYAVWVSGNHADTASTALSFYLYDYWGTLKKSIVNHAARVSGNWERGAHFTNDEARNGYISIMAYVPPNNVGTLYGAGVYNE